LEQSIKISPNEIDAYLLYLRILAGGEIDDKVIQLCKEAIKIAPTNSDARTEYGRMLALQGKTDEAIKQFELALKYNTNNETTLVFLGIIAQEKGNVESAISYYRRSVRANPLNVKMVLRLGNYYLELKKWNEAIKLFENALISSPNNIDLLERLAWVKSTCPNSKIRNGNEAVELGRRIALISKLNASQDIRCGITLAVSYAEIGDFDRAKNILRNMIVRANETNTKSYISSIEGLIRLFDSKIPYRL
jgi:tetratricopeptide (TPR) repeat protein